MRKFFPIAVFVAVALASLLTAVYAYRTAQDAARFKFEGIADDALNRIVSRIDLQISLLDATHAFFMAHQGDVSSAEFARYFDALSVQSNFAGLRGIGMLREMKPGEEATIATYLNDPRVPVHQIWPVSTADRLTPVILFQPMDEEGRGAIGFDMYSRDDFRGTIDASRETGEARATRHLDLGGLVGDGDHAGFIVFRSLEEKAPAEEAATRHPVSGYLFAVLRAADIIDTALRKVPLLPVHVEVHDGPTNNKSMFYASAQARDPAYGNDYAVVRQILVAGQPWTVVFQPTVDFSPPSSLLLPLAFGLIGLMLAAAIAMLAWYQWRSYAVAEELRLQGERSLAEKDLMLQEMKHRIKNMIARIGAIARQTAGQADNVEDFSQSFGARLQAMANSQDMLTRSRWQKADLEELLRVELGQVFGRNLPEDMLSGPRMLLSEAATQALGLTFHELATNALKYGGVGQAQDALTVSWTIVPGKPQPNFKLLWSEQTGKPVTAPERAGFGTRLIDMNITRELNGTIERKYRSDGLTIEIVVPLSALMEQRGKPQREPRIRLLRPAEKSPEAK